MTFMVKQSFVRLCENVSSINALEFNISILHPERWTGVSSLVFHYY